MNNSQTNQFMQELNQTMDFFGETYNIYDLTKGEGERLELWNEMRSLNRIIRDAKLKYVGGQR